MKKVLITGGAGFIGSNFVYKFLEMGYGITVFERKEANFWRIEKVLSQISLYSPDLSDANETEKIIYEIKPDIVIHLAAYGAYQKIQQDIKTTINTNLVSSINLINACNKIGIEAFINTGSNSEYGIKEEPMKETDVLEPDNLYGITKSAVSQYCQMMARKYDFPAVTIRPFAVFGYFEEKERLVPTIIKACLENSELNLSRPDSVRDFIFIEDLMSGYLSAIENIGKSKGEIFNLGSGEQRKIKDVVNIVKKITGAKINPAYGEIKTAQTEPANWVSDISKAEKILDWHPEHSLEQGLEKDIEWFKNNLSSYR